MAKLKDTKITVEKIALCEVELRYYQTNLDNGGFDKQISSIEVQICKLQHDLQRVKNMKNNAPQKIEELQRKIANYKGEMNLVKVQPMIEKTKRVIAQLMALKSELASCDLSEEDLAVLKKSLENINE